MNRSLLTAPERNLSDGQINDALTFLSSLTGAVVVAEINCCFFPSLTGI